MKILFTAKGTTWDSAMDPRFGRTQFFFVYDEESTEIQTFDNVAIGEQAHGAGPKTAQEMAEFSPDVLITGNGPGGNASMVLQTSQTEIYVGAGEMTVKEAYEAFQQGTLKKFQQS